MEKELKDLILEMKKSLKKIEQNIEARSKNFTEEINVFWIDLKKHLSSVEDKLDDAYDRFEDNVKLKGHLSLMEARERMEKLEDIANEFTSKISSHAQEELDIMTLKAHLLKMDSEEYWENKQQDLSKIYENSKEEAEKLAAKAAKEMNHIFLKLTEIL